MASDSGPNAMCETGGFDVGPVTLAIRPGIGNSEAHNTEDMTHSELVMLSSDYLVGFYHDLPLTGKLRFPCERIKFVMFIYNIPHEKCYFTISLLLSLSF